METAVLIAAIVQAITAVVIAVATIVYTRVTLRMFQSGIEPNVSVELTGSIARNSISIHNDAGCPVNDVTVFISVGAEKDGEPYPTRGCIFSKTWSSLSPGEQAKTNRSPINESDLRTDNDKLPPGVLTNPYDLIVNYTFVRTADSRRYHYQYQVGLLRNPDGTLFYIPTNEPEQVQGSKRMIVRSAS